MKIQYLGNGFANQIRQYLFARYAERRNPKEIFLFDDSFFSAHPVHNGYELERVFSLKLNLASNFFSAEEWKKIVPHIKKGVSFPQILLNLGLSIVMVEDYCKHQRFRGEIVRNCGFSPWIAELPYTNVYYYCLWSDPGWFAAYEEENRKELQFPQITDISNLKYEDKIKSSYSVGIHIRRGGFRARNWDLPAEVYKLACKRVVEEHPDAHFFIFSDDLDWCRANKIELGFHLAKKSTYITGNTGKNSYIDMQLLSMCRGMICNAVSSFSQVAGWLNPGLEFEIKLKNE